MRRLTFAALLGAASLSAGPAEATDPPIAIGEVAAPPPSAGIDAAAIRDTAEGEIRRIDTASLPNRRRVVVSLSLRGTELPDGVQARPGDGARRPIACTIDALIRDAKTGAMIAIIEAGAQAEGPPSSEIKKLVAHAAIRSAVRKIPRALGAK